MSDNFVKVASKTELIPGSIKALECNGQKIALCHTMDGNFYAVGDTCSHAKVALHTGQLLEAEIECPKHGARFDLKNGQALCPPAVQPIPVYALEVRGDDIFLSVPEASQTPTG